MISNLYFMASYYSLLLDILNLLLLLLIKIIIAIINLKLLLILLWLTSLQLSIINFRIKINFVIKITSLSIATFTGDYRSCEGCRKMLFWSNRNNLNSKIHFDS